MALNSGDYNRRITVQVGTAAIDSAGERTHTWALYKTLWAKVEPLLGDAMYKPEVEWTKNKAVFKVRYSTDAIVIEPDTYRVSYNSDLYDIEAVVDVAAAHKEIHIKGVRRD